MSGGSSRYMGGVGQGGVVWRGGIGEGWGRGVRVGSKEEDKSGRRETKRF